MDPGKLGKPEDIQALIREQASLVAVERGEIVGFLALGEATSTSATSSTFGVPLKAWTHRVG